MQKLGACMQLMREALGECASMYLEVSVYVCHVVFLCARVGGCTCACV